MLAALAGCQSGEAWPIGIADQGNTLVYRDAHHSRSVHIADSRGARYIGEGSPTLSRDGKYLLVMEVKSDTAWRVIFHDIAARTSYESTLPDNGSRCLQSGEVFFEEGPVLTIRLRYCSCRDEPAQFGPYWSWRPNTEWRQASRPAVESQECLDDRRYPGRDEWTNVVTLGPDGWNARRAVWARPDGSAVELLRQNDVLGQTSGLVAILPLAIIEFPLLGFWYVGMRDSLHQLCFDPSRDETDADLRHAVSEQREIHSRPPSHSPRFRQVRLFDVHGARIRSVDLSPDGLRALSGDSTSIVRILDIASGQELISTPIDAPTDQIQVAFSPDGRRFAYCGWSAVFFRDASTGGLLRGSQSIGTNDSVRAICFSPDGTRLAAATFNGRVYLLDAQSGDVLSYLGTQTGAATAAAFSPDGSRVVTSAGRTVSVWSINSDGATDTFENLAGSPRNSHLCSVAFSPDGRKVLAGGRNGTVCVWDVATGDILNTFAGHQWVVSSVACCPDGLRAVSGGWDNVLRLWDLATGQELGVFEGHAGFIRSIAVSRDGRFVLSGSDDGTIRLWQLPSAAETQGAE